MPPNWSEYSRHIAEARDRHRRIIAAADHEAAEAVQSAYRRWQKDRRRPGSDVASEADECFLRDVEAIRDQRRTAIEPAERAHQLELRRIFQEFRADSL